MSAPATSAAVRIGPEGLPARTLGWQILGWTREYLLQPDGPQAGEPWVFTPEQARFVLHWYAVDANGRFIYRYGMYRRMKGHGKDPLGAALCCIEFVGPCRFGGWRDGEPVAQPHAAAWVQTAAVSRDQTRNTMTLFPGMLSPRAIEEFGIDLGKEIIYAGRGRRRIEAVTSSPRALEGGRATFILKNEALALDTVLPTPDGWTTVGAVKSGDRLYGSACPVNVLHTTDVRYGRPCFRLTFEDGTALIADEGHRWFAKRTSSNAHARIWTTGEMFHDSNRRQGRGVGFMVPLVAPLDSPEASLPLDPYVLGYWLGDGASQGANITVGEEDRVELEEELTRRGFQFVASKDARPGVARLCLTLPGCRRNRNDPRPLGVRGQLAALGLLQNKHIPAIYLRASQSQRLDFLRGLMDSDGCLGGGHQSQAVFTNQNEELARGVLELVRSLGYRAGIRSKLDERWTNRPRLWRVYFRADERVNPFRLPHKATRVTGERRGWKTIRKIEPVASVPVRCIEVDSADHLFVAGDGWTLTHNTHHWLAPNEGHEMAKVIARNAAKSRDGSSRVLAISNAHAPGEDSDAEHDWEAWQKISQGLSRATGFLYDSLEAPPDTDLADEDSLRAGILAARGDSAWIDPDRLIAEIRDPRTSPSMARRFYLNQIVAEEDKPFDRRRWDDLVRPDYRVADGALITLGFDGSVSRDHTALIGTEVATGYQWVVGYWEPEVGADGEARIPVAQVDETVDAAFSRWRVWRMNADPFYWKDMAAQWAGRYGDDVVVSWSTTQYRKMAASLLAYRNAMQMGELSHDGDQRFAAAIANAHKHMQQFRDDQGEPMWIIQKERPDSPLKIDAAMAGCLSWEARTAAVAAGALSEPEVGVTWA